MDQEANPSRCREIRQTLRDLDSNLNKKSDEISSARIRLNSEKQTLSNKRDRLGAAMRKAAAAKVVTEMATTVLTRKPGRTALNRGADVTIDTALAVMISNLQSDIKGLENTVQLLSETIRSFESTRARFTRSLADLSREGARLNCVL